jgi:DNA-binding NarL/FixJ family response regulator
MDICGKSKKLNPQNTTPVNPIKIAIVEDEPEFQEWILEEINEVMDVECVGRYDVAEDALKHLPQLQPDIVIMDLALQKSDMNGLECMLRLRLVAPEMKFLVLSAQSDESHIFEALRVGAGAYIQKDEIPDKLITLIREFHGGDSPMSRGIAKRVIESFRKPAEDLLRLTELSPKESQVLEILSKGFLYKEAADQMGIVEGTVKQHAHKIYKKLQVYNLVEAIRRYLMK